MKTGIFLVVLGIVQILGLIILTAQTPRERAMRYEQYIAPVSVSYGQAQEVPGSDCTHGTIKLYPLLKVMGAHVSAMKLEAAYCQGGKWRILPIEK